MTTPPPGEPPKGRCLAYLRVSTPRQGEGVSLLTQREKIARFARRRGLLVTGWHEELTSAARKGRPVFGKILEALRKNRGLGLIVHKVDRSTRNLGDWAALGELIDRGVAVYFAGDGLDLSSRSDRLAADIQAVIDADYVRNLREEAKRGIQRRLEQGLYPMRAPVGYLDMGRGKPKAVDPDRGEPASLGRNKKGPIIDLNGTEVVRGTYHRKTPETSGRPDEGQTGKIVEFRPRIH